MFAAFCDNGITHFDLANNYAAQNQVRTEKNLGRILKEEMSAYRDELTHHNKSRMWNVGRILMGDGGSRKYLLASLDQSLEKNGNRITLIFYHHRMDPETPLEGNNGGIAQAVKKRKGFICRII
ncbi:MAG: aldo/keto reductase [Eubacterium ventriosum]